MNSPRHLETRLRLHLLRAISSIDEQRSLTRASAAIGITQPSLTKSLSILEELAQTQLVERHARGVRTTPAGAAVAHTANRIFAELRKLDADLDRLSGQNTERLSLGVLPTAASGILPGVMSRLSRSHPNLKIRLERGYTEDLLRRLTDGDIELVVGRLYTPAVEDGFKREPLWDEPMAILARAGHPAFEKEFSCETLRRFNLLLPSVTQRVSEETETLLAKLGLDSVTAIRSSSFSFIREMLHETDGIALMPSLMMVGDLLRGTLRIVPTFAYMPPRPAGLIMISGQEFGPAARAFVGSLRGYISDIATRGLPPPGHTG